MFHCRRAKRLRGEDAVPAASPRPRHHGPLLAAQLAFLLLAWTCRVSVLLNTDGGGGSLSYHSSVVDAICRRRPTRPRFLAALGPLSSSQLLSRFRYSIPSDRAVLKRTLVVAATIPDLLPDRVVAGSQPPPRPPLGLLPDPAGSRSREFSAFTTRKLGASCSFPRHRESL